MHNRDILALDIVDDHLPNLRVQPAIPQQKDVAALKGRLHAAREDDDDWRGGVGEEAEALPHHEGGAEDEGEVEDLGEELPPGERG